MARTLNVASCGSSVVKRRIVYMCTALHGCPGNLQTWGGGRHKQEAVACKETANEGENGRMRCVQATRVHNVLL